MKTTTATMMLGCLLLFFGGCASSTKNTRIHIDQKHLVQLISEVNNRWQAENPYTVNAFWDNAAYHTGNMAAYALTQNESWKDYSENWAKFNQWKGARSDDKNRWKYHYGESNDFVLFGDWQICFQTYIDLYRLDTAEYKIARAKEVMTYEMSTTNNDYWWWADGLYMVMPVMTKLYRVTQDTLYLQKLEEYYRYAENLMYDKESHLFYRDAKYIFPKEATKNQLKNFWSRGNGWVFAAYAKILEDLPSCEFRSHIEKRFQEMASSLKACQQEEGYWTRSLIDAEHAPGYETSGTAFFTYGYFWGINHGLLDSKEYLPTAAKAWNYLEKIALQKDYSIGYVQPIGERAIPGQHVSEKSTSGFGTGAFLLAACELAEFISK